MVLTVADKTMHRFGIDDFKKLKKLIGRILFLERCLPLNWAILLLSNLNRAREDKISKDKLYEHERYGTEIFRELHREQRMAIHLVTVVAIPILLLLGYMASDGSYWDVFIYLQGVHLLISMAGIYAHYTDIYFRPIRRRKHENVFTRGEAPC